MLQIQSQLVYNSFPSGLMITFSSLMFQCTTLLPITEMVNCTCNLFEQMLDRVFIQIVILLNQVEQINGVWKVRHDP